MSGTPFLGHPLSLLFYPSQLIFLFLPINRAFNYIFALHTFLLGLNSYLLMRWGFNAQRGGSLLTAMSLMFTPKIMAHISGGHVSLIQALAWLPLVLLFSHLLITRGALLYAVLAGVFLALQFLADVRIVFYTILLLVFYAAWHLGADYVDFSDKQAWLRLKVAPVLKGGLCLAATMAALSAVQLLPFGELLGYVNRSSLSLSEGAKYALPFPLLYTLLLPSSLKFPEWYFYLGILPLILAACAVLLAHNRVVIFFLAMTLFALAFSLGPATPLFPAFFKLVPGAAALRVPTRMWFLGVFSIAILAGFGLDILAGQGGGITKIRWVIRLNALMLLVGSVGFVAYWAIYHHPSVRLTMLSLLCAATLGLLWLLTKERVWRGAFVVVSCVLLLSDLWLVDFSLIKPVDIATLLELPDTLGYLGRQEGLFRIYAPRQVWSQHLTVAAGIQTVGGIDPFQLKRYADFMQLASGLPCPEYAASIPPFYTAEVDCGDYLDAKPNLALLGLLNAGYLVAPFPLNYAGSPLQQHTGQVYLYINRQVLPRAFVVHRVEVVAEETQIFSSLSTIEPGKLALVEGGPGLPSGLQDDYQEARVTLYSPNRIVTQVSTDSPGFLVLGEVWAPGWRAFDNGHEIQLYRVDYTLRGVYLGAGQHTVEFIYSPDTFYWGSRISILSWLLLVIYLVLRLRPAYERA